ncbi:MAG: UDP-N-acetylenolpyruvoylglucosamine reductase [Zetaproteobacteria bacterium CG1_02_49_23]|nr:MAG: UDP-N-acetylenolpyruvoylglucosamine reductase [Zetaproteobacteria bacterium CG1_02_49_23]
MSWWQRLEACGECREYEPLASRTTMGTGGSVRWFFMPLDVNAIAEAMKIIPLSVKVIGIGRGSNSLVPDVGLEALVMDFSKLQHLSITGNSLIAQCGMRMPKLAQHAANHGLCGLEFMATIPGDVGGGIVMNAGAFGQQVSDTLQRIEIVHRDGQQQSIARSELQISYRHTTLPVGAMVVQGEFNLASAVPDDIRNKIRDMRAKRTATQPLFQPNCGSVFKNPQGDHAARLIEACGLKGMQIGRAMISEQHANFIVNLDTATTEDVLKLIKHAQKQVTERFGVLLETEVRVLGGYHEST